MSAGSRPEPCDGETTEQATPLIRIAIVDPYPIYRLGVIELLKRFDGLLVVAEGATAAEAVRAVREIKPDILLMDISMPEKGIETLLAIARRDTDCKLVAFTAIDDVVSISRVLAAGIKGYILKGISGADLVAALKAIYHGAPYVSPELASRLLVEAKGAALVQMREDKRCATLNHREEQLLALVSKGLQNKEIADQLGLTVGTVKHYLTRLFKKMQVRNRVEAIALSSSEDHEPAW